MLNSSISADDARNTLDYDPDTGLFKHRFGHRAGLTAGSITSEGYVAIRIRGKYVKAHRLAWLYVHGVWPTEIDHINHDRQDNRISNLRETTRVANVRNRGRARHDSRTGLIGVSPSGKKFQARICVNGRELYLGLHSTPEEARAAYLAAKQVHHA